MEPGDASATATEVRPANEPDRDVLTGVLTRAFSEDPLLSWAIPDAAARARWSPRFFAWELRRLAGQDVSWTTSTLGGAALWALPGQWHESALETVRLVLAMAPGVGRRAPRVMRHLLDIERRHPTTPHLYLAILGVDPGQQGTGVGSALLTPGLRLCDEEGLPAYLETATERNLAFYGRHGFAVTAEIDDAPRPRVWTMWREPRA